MRRITIKSRKIGFFDGCPVCDVIIDNKRVGQVLQKKTVAYDLDDNVHQIYCSYRYGKGCIEKSNTVIINDKNDHNFILGTVYAKTYKGRFEENARTINTKGYINVPDIELYEE